MSQLGFGVMINMLGGNEETVNAIKSSLNKKISSVKLIDNKLCIGFDDRTMLTIWDGGQSCCEHRYMVTDDDMNYYVGSKLVDVRLKEAPVVEDQYAVHEVQFLEVVTDNGSFVMANHNEHNGYYGGFWIQATKDSL